LLKHGGWVAGGWGVFGIYSPTVHPSRKPTSISSHNADYLEASSAVNHACALFTWFENATLIEIPPDGGYI
jgi:hypothetical protein